MTTLQTEGGFLRIEGTEAEVCRDISERQQKGIAKYGTTVANNPLTHQQWLQHAYEEALDLAIYLKRAMQSEQAIADMVQTTESMGLYGPCKTCKNFTQGKNPLVGTYDIDCRQCANYYTSQYEPREPA